MISESGGPGNPEALLLNIETSGITCGAALSLGGRLLAESTAHIKNIHSRQLSPFIDQLLSTCGKTAENLDGIVLSAGPGSFTGLRIGYSVAKGFAFALAIPIIEVPTLDIWAYQNSRQQLPIMPIINAHRGDVYCAIYRWAEDGPQKVLPDTLSAITDLPDLSGDQPILLCGADAHKLKTPLAEALGKKAQWLLPAAMTPQLWALAILGQRRFQSGDFSDTANCEPSYIRKFQGVS